MEVSKLSQSKSVGERFIYQTHFTAPRHRRPKCHGEQPLGSQIPLNRVLGVYTKRLGRIEFSVALSVRSTTHIIHGAHFEICNFIKTGLY
jgi:hypothetical protein